MTTTTTASEINDNLIAPNNGEGDNDMNGVHSILSDIRKKSFRTAKAAKHSHGESLRGLGLRRNKSTDSKDLLSVGGAVEGEEGRRIFQSNHGTTNEWLYPFGDDDNDSFLEK